MQKQRLSKKQSLLQISILVSTLDFVEEKLGINNENSQTMYIDGKVVSTEEKVTKVPEENIPANA